ncbi:hypothetical protein [Paenibacillus sp. Marseille-Q9583]
MSEMRDKAEIAITQKTKVLERGEGGGYTPVPHDLFRTVLPDLHARYSKPDARDALFLLMYLHAYVNGTSANEYYMWAFPTVAQIRIATGIHVDRIKPLCDILEREGLLITKRIPWSGNTKKLYLPLFYSEITAIPIDGAA